MCSKSLVYCLLELNMLCDCVTRGCGDHSPLTSAAILEWRRRRAWGGAAAARRGQRGGVQVRPGSAGSKSLVHICIKFCRVNIIAILRYNTIVRQVLILTWRANRCEKILCDDRILLRPVRRRYNRSNSTWVPAKS